MNIFMLDADPVKAAQYQHDRHVVKMTLETTQLLATAFRILGVGENWMYQSTHPNHPCAVWTRERKANAHWLARHGVALAEEYTYRYGKHHACEAHLRWFETNSNLLPLPYSPRRSTPPQCMPDEYRCKNPVLAYRTYYVAEKIPGNYYTRRRVPGWVWKYQAAA